MFVVKCEAFFAFLAVESADVAIPVHTTGAKLTDPRPVQLPYYRKRGSASYIVREVHSVRERERERERDTERERRK